MLDSLAPPPTDPTAPKPFYLSKTLIANGISLVVLAVGLILESAGALHLDPQLVIWIGIGLAVLNALLRLVTASAIQGTPAAAKAEVAKQNIALNAAHEVLATTQPTAPAGPSVNDLKAQVAELVRTRDDANALLAQLGALANPNPTLPLSGVT